MTKADPAWLKEAREVCRQADIKIAAHGNESLVVYLGSPRRAAEIASQLAPLGLQPLDDEDDDSAGLLTLCRDPEGARAKEREPRTPRYSDFSKPPLLDQLTPALELLFSILSFWLGKTRFQRFWILIPFGTVLLAKSIWDGARIWGWSVYSQSEGLKLRRHFRWTVIPWDQIHSVETRSHYGRGQHRETVTLITRDRSLGLGTFGYPFARALRDYLRDQIALHQKS